MKVASVRAPAEAVFLEYLFGTLLRSKLYQKIFPKALLSLAGCQAPDALQSALLWARALSIRLEPKTPWCSNVCTVTVTLQSLWHFMLQFFFLSKNMRAVLVFTC